MPVPNIIPLAISLGSLIVAVVSLVLSFKKTSMESFEYKLRRLQDNSAVLRTSTEKMPGGKYLVRIANVGRSEARDVVCDFNGRYFELITVRGETSFPELPAGACVGVVFYCIEGKPDNVFFNVSWNDNLKQRHKAILNACLL